MSAALAGAASRLGPVYLALVPVVGGLGGFIAGSNTGANAMFAASQAHAAHALGASNLQVLATQNVSASLLTMAAPPRVALASSLASTKSPAPSASPQANTSGATTSPAPGVTSTISATAKSQASETVHTRTVMRAVLATDAIVLAVLGVLNLFLA
jgi:lactate permease